jgi:hypothetical protein
MTFSGAQADRARPCIEIDDLDRPSEAGAAAKRRPEEAGREHDRVGFEIVVAAQRGWTLDAEELLQRGGVEKGGFQPGAAAGLIFPSECIGVEHTAGEIERVAANNGRNRERPDPRRQSIDGEA